MATWALTGLNDRSRGNNQSGPINLLEFRILRFALGWFDKFLIQHARKGHRPTGRVVTISRHNCIKGSTRRRGRRAIHVEENIQLIKQNSGPPSSDTRSYCRAAEPLILLDDLTISSELDFVPRSLLIHCHHQSILILKWRKYNIFILVPFS